MAIETTHLLYINNTTLSVGPNDAGTSFYQEKAHAFNPTPTDPRPFLALEQTSGSSIDEKVKLLDTHDGTDRRLYEMIQNYNPNGVEESPSSTF